MNGFNYWYFDKEISHEICQKIIKLGKGKWEQAITLGLGPVDGVRKSDIVWVQEQWVYNLI